MNEQEGHDASWLTHLTTIEAETFHILFLIPGEPNRTITTSHSLDNGSSTFHPIQSHVAERSSKERVEYKSHLSSWASRGILEKAELEKGR